MVGQTLIVDVLEPVLHKYDTPPLADKVVQSFKHIDWSGPASAAGNELTVTVTSSLSLHPFESVTVTV